MFVIRKAQMEALEAHMQRAYEDRLVRRLARGYPGRFAGQGEEAIRRFVRTGIGNAERYGITEDEDVADFVLLLARHGLNFEQAPEMSECREILENRDLPGDVKVCLLAEELAAAPPDSEPNPPRS